MALMRIDQASEAGFEGSPGVARNWGMAESTVYLVDLTPGGETLFEILWADDEQSAATLHPSEGDGHTWEFTPAAAPNGGGNAIRIRLTHTGPGQVVSTQIRIFGIPDANGVIPPAPGELADPNASLLNASDPAVIDRCERNWPTNRFPAGQPFGWSDAVPRTPAGAGGSLAPTYFKAYASLQVSMSNASGGWAGLMEKLSALEGEEAEGIVLDGSTLIVPATGLYVLDLMVTYYVSQATPALFALRARCDGVTLAQQVSSQSGFNDDGAARLHAVLALNAGDLVSLEFSQATGGNVAGAAWPNFGGEEARHSNIVMYRIA